MELSTNTYWTEGPWHVHDLCCITPYALLNHRCICLENCNVTPTKQLVSFFNLFSCTSHKNSSCLHVPTFGSQNSRGKIEYNYINLSFGVVCGAWKSKQGQQREGFSHMVIALSRGNRNIEAIVNFKWTEYYKNKAFTALQQQTIATL